MQDIRMSDQVLKKCVQRLKGIFVFGGDIIPAEDPKHLGLGWRSLRRDERDVTGGMPSFERVLAAATLWKMNNNLLFIVSGGASNVAGQIGKSPAIAAVMAAELQADGVPTENIIVEDKSFNTREHFMNCPKIANERGWSSSEIAVLSVFFHFGRITAMLAQLGDSALPFDLAHTSFLSAERVLAAEDPAWNERFKELYASEAMIPTLVGEAMGIGQLWSGHSPRFPHPFKGFKDPLA